MTSGIQSVTFKRDNWDIFNSHQWLMKHLLYPIKGPHITDTTIRYRLINPKRFSRFITKNINDDISLIIGIK